MKMKHMNIWGKKTKQKRISLNLIASLDFGSTVTLGNTNKEIPTRAPMSTLSQDQVTRRTPGLENEGGIPVQPQSLAETGSKS